MDDKRIRKDFLIFLTLCIERFAKQREQRINSPKKMHYWHRFLVHLRFIIRKMQYFRYKLTHGKDGEEYAIPGRDDLHDSIGEGFFRDAENRQEVHALANLMYDIIFAYHCKA